MDHVPQTLNDNPMHWTLGPMFKSNLVQINQDPVLASLESLRHQPRLCDWAIQWELEYGTFKFRTHSKSEQFDVQIWDALFLE